MNDPGFEYLAEAHRRMRRLEESATRAENALLRAALAARHPVEEASLSPKKAPRPGTIQRRLYDQINGHPRGAEDLSRLLRVRPLDVASSLCEMAKRGYITRAGKGMYVRAALTALLLCVVALAGCTTPSSSLHPPSSKAVPALVDVALIWDRSPSTNVAGYKLHYGPASGVYLSALTLGNVTNALVPGLSSTARWYFAASAYAANGQESIKSNEAVWPAAPKTNRVVTLALLTNATPTGPWTQDRILGNYTNPPAPAQFWKLEIRETHQ